MTFLNKGVNSPVVIREETLALLNWTTFYEHHSLQTFSGLLSCLLTCLPF